MKNEMKIHPRARPGTSTISHLSVNTAGRSWLVVGNFLTFSGGLEAGVNSVTVMMGRDMEWTGGGGGGGTGGGTTFTCGTSTTDGFAEDEAECAGVPDGEPPLRSP